MLKPLLCVFCLWSLFVNSNKSFSQEFEFSNDTLIVNTIGQKEGLLQINVKKIQQDSLGFLWLSTEDGLHRFNSNQFKVYLHNPKDSLSIPEDHARDIYIVNDTLFAVSNSKGAFGLKLSTDKFFKILEPVTSKIGIGYKVLPVNDSFLLFSMRDYFLLYNRKEKKAFRVNLPQNKVENYVKDIIPLNKSEYLLATKSSGLLRFNLVNFSISKEDNVDDTCHNILFKYKEKVCLGTDLGLYLYENKKSKLIIHNEVVKCVYTDVKDVFWIGTTKNIFKVDFSRKKITNVTLLGRNGESYSQVEINTIKGDSKGNIWFGTEGEELLHFNKFQKKFKTLRLKIPRFSSEKKISSYQFLSDKDSTFFIGNTYGILKYNNLKNEFKHYKETDNILIYTIVKDVNDDVWAGGFTSGLLKYDKDNNRFVEVIGRGTFLSDRDVIQITPVNANELLVATWAGGIYKYLIKENKFTEFFINSERLDRARVSFVDSRKGIWLGSDEGLYHIDVSENITQYTSETKQAMISGNRVFGITEDSFGNIWIGTNSGLTKLNVKTQKTQLYYKQKGLPNDFIYTVLVDDINNIWVSTNLGLSVLNTKTNIFQNYTEKDGLQNNEFNGKAGFKDNYGNFYFGGIDGVNVFNPQELKNNPYSPKVNIESLELFNSEIKRNELYKDFLEFKSNENVLTINYSAINYLNPEKVNYSYMLEGFDQGWREITKKRNTTYTNLNPGDYTFKVKATNDSGIWSNEEDYMKIKVIPPWYKTNWFKAIIVLIVLMFLGFFYWFKTQKLKKDKLKLEALVKQRTIEIIEKNKALRVAFSESEDQKNNIKFLMRELRHRVKNNLQIISSLLNIQANNLENANAIESLKVAKNRILTISKLEDKIESNKDVIELKEFTSDICNSILRVLSDDNKLRFNVSFNFNKLEVKNFNTILYGLILNELITNTVKYAFDVCKEENLLEVIYYKKGSILFFIVKDNGRGYSQNEISNKSLGLDLVKDMVSQLNGEIEIDSKNGTTNIIKISLKKENYVENFVN